MKAKWTIAIVAVLLVAAWLVFLIHRHLSPPLKETAFVLSPGTPEGEALIRPAHFVMPDGRGNYAQEVTNSAGKPTTFLSGRGVTIPEMISAAYSFSRARIVFPPDIPTNRYDYLVTVSDKQREKLQSLIQGTFGYAAHPDKREMSVLALKVVAPDSPNLQVSTNSTQRWRPPDRLQHFNIGILVWPTESRLLQPVVNETHLTNYYDFHWNFMLRDRASIDRMLANLGLDLEPERQEINVLVVEKAH